MNSKTLSHDELQYIEHSNKILREHQELVTKVINDTEGMLNNYVPILSAYISSIVDLRKSFGEEVVHVVQSTRQLKIVTSNVQDIVNFMAAVEKLDKLLTPELIEKLKRISK